MKLEMTLARLCECIAGKAQGDPGKNLFNGVVINADQIRGGELFFSLHVDPELEAYAFSRGAAGIVTEQFRPAAEVPEAAERTIVVANVTRALMNLALWWLEQNPQVRLCVVTGGTGKTTTKEFLARMLIALDRGAYTHGSDNSAVAIATTLCQIDNEASWVVLEALPETLAFLPGTRIDLLLYMGTNPRALQSIPDALSDTTTLICSAELRIPEVAAHCNRHTFGTEETADIIISDAKLIGIRATECTLTTATETAAFFVTVPGSHIAATVAAAVAAATQLFPEVRLQDLGEAIRHMNPIEDRLYLHRLPGDRYLFNDTAQASLESFIPLCSLVAAAQEDGLSTGVLCGDLDFDSEIDHATLFAELAAVKPGFLVVTGKHAESMLTKARSCGIRAMSTKSAEAAVHTARKFNWQVLFIKGGNRTDMKRAVALLLELEGEVLEIPQDLAQFGSAELKKE